NFGELDEGSPIAEVRAGLETIAEAYEQAGARERFGHYIEEDASHVLSDEMWQRTSHWFRKHLS
ncbi:MAG: dienelactone hydrolase family protein, partial [Planctomycetota bacterium]